MKTFVFTYSFALLLSLGLTPLVITWAKSIKLVDHPNARSIHKQPIARLGGIAIFLAAVLAILPALFFENSIGQAFRSQMPQVFALVAGGITMFALGVYDDLFGCRAVAKLLAQIIAAVLLCAAGVRIDHISLSSTLSIDLGFWGTALTVMWLIGITNAVNLIDGLDGLAAGISAIACGVIAALGILTGNTILAILMLAILGALTGFLCFNFNPARIFMGDSGSLFLGYMLAGTSVLTAAKTETLFSIALPILVLGIPIYDTLFSIVRRFLERRGLMSPDRGHFHHRLLDMGFAQHQVALIAYVITLLMACLGFALLCFRNSISVAYFLCCLIILLQVFRWFGVVRLREVSIRVRQRALLSRQQRKERKEFDEIQLHFRNAHTFDDWWQALCFASERFHFSELVLSLINRDGTRRRLSWRSDSIQNGCVVEMVLPVPDRRSASIMNVKICVPFSGSLEAIGRRVTFMSRLMEENSLRSDRPVIYGKHLNKKTTDRNCRTMQ